MKRICPKIMSRGFGPGGQARPVRRARAGLGKEIQQPTAVVILGGTVTSTFLNMIVIPALHLKYGRAEAHAPSRDYPRGRELAPAGD